MDRNTLTALLLITIVLILTPYYMDLVSPPPQPSYETTDDFADDNSQTTDDYTYNPDTKPKNKLEPLQQKSTEEKITTVESDLYIAKISSLCGLT